MNFRFYPVVVLSALLCCIGCVPTNESFANAAEAKQGVPDWVTQMNYDPRDPFDPEKLRTLLEAEHWDSDSRDGRRIQFGLLHAGAAKDGSFRYAFDKDSLKHNPAYEMIFAAYRYSALGERNALDEIMAADAATGYFGGDTAARLVLPWIDEWDRTIIANRRHAAAPADGTAGFMNTMFPNIRPILFPEKYADYLERIGSTEKLLRELVGVVADDSDLTYDFGIPFGFNPLSKGRTTFRVKELPRPGATPLWLVHLGSEGLALPDLEKQRTFVFEKVGESFVEVTDVVLPDEWHDNFYLVPARDDYIIKRRAYVKQENGSISYYFAEKRIADLAWKNGAFHEGGFAGEDESDSPTPWWKQDPWKR